MSKDQLICFLLWLFGGQYGGHLVYMRRPLLGLVWYIADGTFDCRILDLFLIWEQLNSMSTATPDADSQRHKTLSVFNLLALDVWFSALITEMATELLVGYGAQPEWIELVPIVSVPLGVLWIASMKHEGVSWQAAQVSSLVGYGLYLSLYYTLVTQGVVSELFFKTDKRKFVLPILTTTILNVWLHRSWLSGQCVRLVKLVVKVVLVLLVLILLLRPYYLTYTDTPNDDNRRYHHTHQATMTEEQKVLSACEVLGVHPGVSEEMLTVNYRHLVRQWHPDKHQGQYSKDTATQRFIQIQEAYQYLSHKLTGGRRT